MVQFDDDAYKEQRKNKMKMISLKTMI